VLLWVVSHFGLDCHVLLELSYTGFFVGCELLKLWYVHRDLKLVTEILALASLGGCSFSS